MLYDNDKNYTKKIRVAARKYARNDDPNNVNSFITYLHEDEFPETMRTHWVYLIDLLDLEPDINRIFEQEQETA